MTVPSGMVWSKPGKPKRSRKSAEIVPFPAGQHTALPKPGTMLLPARSKAERAKLRIDLGALRGVLLAEQIAVLGRHQELLADYAHLLALCLAPRDHLSLEGLSEMAHAEKIAAVQKEALSQVLPTERDTLAGAIKTLTSSLATTVQLKLRVADLAHSCIRNDEDEDRAGGRTRINELDTPTLRKVHEAMRALTGQRAKAAGAAKPTATRAN